MNLIFLSDQGYPYGMAGSKRIRLFAEYLASKNKVKIIIAAENNGNNESSGSEKNVAFQFIRFSKFQNLFSYFKIKMILKNNYLPGEKNILFLYDNVTLMNILFAVAGKKIGYKIITDIVEDYSLTKENESLQRRIQYKVSNLIQKRLNSLVDGVVIISEYLFKKYSHLRSRVLIPVSAENLHINFSDVPKTSQDINMVYSGSFGNKDGIIDLLMAFKIISQRFENVQLTLSGKINEKITNEIKGNDRIKYVGLISDDKYYSFLQEADILLMTRVNSEYANAGFPFKLGEYLATGNPVIATKVSDVEIYLKDKVDAILAEASNVQSLVSAFEFAITEREEANMIGKSGKEKCTLFFDPKKNGETLQTFLNSI
ncbi:MAG: glycosyltransferase [Bacteroidia bacterium]